MQSKKSHKPNTKIVRGKQTKKKKMFRIILIVFSALFYDWAADVWLVWARLCTL